MKFLAYWHLAFQFKRGGCGDQGDIDSMTRSPLPFVLFGIGQLGRAADREEGRRPQRMNQSVRNAVPHIPE